MKHYIKFPSKSATNPPRYVVDAPPTGFRSVTNPKKATAFESEAAAREFMAARGIFSATEVVLEGSEVVL